MNPIIAMDENILLFLQEHVRNDILTPIMKAFSFLGDNGGVFWIVIALAMIFIKKTRKPGICIAIAMTLSGIFTNLIIKHLVDRVRPYDVISDLTVITKYPSDASFPSGHASLIFAIGVAAFLSLSLIMNKKKAHLIGAAVLVVAAILSFSRLYLGVHYPTDVLAGILLGIAYGICGNAIGRFIFKKTCDKEKPSPESVPHDQTDTDPSQKP